MSDSELLAIIIKSGTKGRNCLEISKTLLSIKKDGLSGFEYLKKVSIDELKTFKGIGRVKALQIKAMLELSKRIEHKGKNAIKKITTPKDVYDLLRSDLEEKEVEILKLVLLNRKNIVKSVVTVSIGGQGRAVIGGKEIMSEPLKQMAAGIIMVHNHPSGDSYPSKEDIAITRKVQEMSSIFDINLLDHIVIGKEEYTSIREINSSIFVERGKLL